MAEAEGPQRNLPLLPRRDSLSPSLPLPPPLPQTDVPVGARIQHFAQTWLQLSQNSWVLQVVQEGLKLSFNSHPPLTGTPVWTRVSKDPSKAAALRKEVAALLEKQASVVVHKVSSPGFYSTLFVVPKPNGKWRPVIDLSALNAFIDTPNFKMETTRAVRNAVAPGDFGVSLDLSDAYLHVPIHLSSMKYLRFAVDDVVYAFRALPFGLNLSPWVFTRLMDEVMAIHRHSASAVTSNYLDDILQRHQSPTILEKDLWSLLGLMRSLGWIVNLEKSDLVPSQTFIHLGMLFRTADNRVSLSPKRVDKILTFVTDVLQSDSISARRFLSLLGMMNAATDLLVLGRLFLRPIQFALSDMWSQARGSLEDLLPVSESLKNNLEVWNSRTWLEQGVLLRPPSPTLSICCDASSKGWGAHLLPDFQETKGVWDPQEALLHINHQELLAAWYALRAWREALSGSAVLVLSDNTTVVSYIRKQGGTFSRSLTKTVRDILLWCREAHILLSVRHIPGRLNVLADSLSRHGQIIHTEWSLHPQVFENIVEIFQRPHVDLFATRWNRKLDCFVSPVPDPLATAVDALSIDWNGMFAYAFPPSVLIPKVLQKVAQSHCQIILVAPLKWSRSWITLLLDLAVEVPRKLPVRSDLLMQPRSRVFHNDPACLALHVWRLSGPRLDRRDSVPQPWRESLRQEGPQL